MKKSIILFFIISLGCSVNTSQKVELDKLNFSYTDDAYIFFRNMRQSNYDLQVMEEGGWRIYRHEDRQTDTSSFYFNISLVVNWRVNRVYPIIEMPPSVEKKNFEVKWEAIDSDQEGMISMAGQRRKDEMVFASKLYNKLVDEVEIFVVSDGQRNKLFENADHKEAFRVSMYDFYRMTGLL